MSLIYELGRKLPVPEKQTSRDLLRFDEMKPGDVIILSARHLNWTKYYMQFSLGVESMLPNGKVRFTFLDTIASQDPKQRNYTFLGVDNNPRSIEKGGVLDSGFWTPLVGSQGVSYLPEEKDSSGIKVGASNWFKKPGGDWLIAPAVNFAIKTKNLHTS